LFPLLPDLCPTGASVADPPESDKLMQWK